MGTDGYITVTERREGRVALCRVEYRDSWEGAWDEGRPVYIVLCDYAERARLDFMWFARNFVRISEREGGWLVTTAGCLCVLLRRFLDARGVDAIEICDLTHHRSCM